MFNWKRGRQPAPISASVSPHVDTDPHRSAPINTGVESASAGAHQGAPSSATPATTSEDLYEDHPFMVVGAIRSPKEHAVQLVEVMRMAGLEGHAVYQGTIQDLHRCMCKDLTWCERRWLAVGRELKKLPGVRKGKVWGPNGERLTFYEIGPATEAGGNVVPLTVVERKRAAGS